MTEQTEKNTPLVYTSILYIFGLILFLEWIYPVQDITDGNNITIFIVYACVCFIISLFRWKGWIKFLLKGLGLLFFLDMLYFRQPFLSAGWFEQLIVEILFNMETLFSQEWNVLTPLFRSLLFFILIWVMSYLLHYWFVEMKRIFLFVLLTIFYLAVLDTFTSYDAGIAIVRTFIISFLALGLTNLMKEFEMESIRFTWIKKSLIGFLPILGIVLLSSLIGYVAPKLEPMWPDPVPFMQNVVENAGDSESMVQKVGYGEDDSRLGGSFIQDDTPVFRAEAADEHYWRIETKDLYTGKGWEVSAEPDYEIQPNGEISLDSFSNQVETEQREATLQFYPDSGIDKVLYPYGITDVESERPVQFLLNRQTDAIETNVDGQSISLRNYTVHYDQPVFSIEQLNQANSADPAEITERYTQLPQDLPARVGELAEDITASYDTRYEKAKAVEQYFGSNEFTYQTTDVPVPEEDEDYVDQFLFESKAGYCDNFSTSMVVLLRTLDIPTRWVKGFTGGEMIDRGETHQTYEVTNANAHSWVEVYFEGIGWVPFEPTQGFQNLSDFELDQSQEASPEWEDEELPEPELPEEEEEQPEEMDVQNTNQTVNLSLNWWQIGLVVAVLAVIAFLIYRFRLHWQTKIYARKLQHHRNAQLFQEAYHHLLKVLKHHGLKKDPDQTLREFAKMVDTRYETAAMGKLTSYYEHILYKDEVAHPPSDVEVQLWEHLVKKIMG